MKSIPSHRPRWNSLLESSQPLRRLLLKAIPATALLMACIGSASAQTVEQPLPTADFVRGVTWGNARAVREMLERHPELVNARDHQRVPMLAHSATTSMTQLLLEAGANPRSLMPDGRTVRAYLESERPRALDSAVLVLDIITEMDDALQFDPGSKKLIANNIRYLVIAHPKLALLTDPATELSVLHYAVALNSVELARAAVRAGLPPTVRDGQGRTAADLCMGADRCGIYRVLVDELGVPASDVGEWACGNLGALRRLVSRDASWAASTDPAGWTPLHHAAWGGDLASLRLLIKQGVALDAPDVYGNTPLHFAARSGVARAVSALLDAGATHDARNSIQGTPLMHACIDSKVDAVRILLAAGSGLGVEPDRRGRHELDYARYPSRELLSALFDAGATTTPGREPGSFLQAAAKCGYTDVVRKLLAAGVSPGPYKDRGTALHTAVEAGFAEIAHILIEAGAPIDDPDHRGVTALRLAIERNDAIITHMLLEAGAAPSRAAAIFETKGRGFTPVDLPPNSPDAMRVLRAFTGGEPSPGEGEPRR